MKKNNFVSRKNLLIQLLKLVKKDSKIISTTGYTSRELAKIRKEMNLKKRKRFLYGRRHGPLGVCSYWNEFADQETNNLY